MFILFHLLVGLLLGYLLADLVGTRAAVLPCMLGALLPDLVDKPVGLLLLGGAFGSGRIFFHTLAFLLLLLGAGAVVFRRYGRPALLALGVGVASHQVLDFMWRDARTWYYPLLGPFRPINTEGWFLREFLLELTNPLEWLSAAGLLVLLLPVLWPAGTDAFVSRHATGLRAAALGAAPALAVLGLLLIAGGAVSRYMALAGRSEAWETAAVGATLLLAAYAAYRLGERLSADAVSIGLK